MNSTNPWIVPDWPAPANVSACVTTREGGISTAPFDSFNLAAHVGDQQTVVQHNRNILQATLNCQVAWLQQTHSCTAVPAQIPTKHRQAPLADANWTDAPGLACAVLTADCLPVLFCNRAGTRVAAAHAGWRGLLNGILENTLASLQQASEDILVWLGPAIGQAAFEVGPEVRSAFINHDPQAKAAFILGQQDRWHADLYQLARQRLAASGIHNVYGGGFCTHTDPLFYSYRRNPVTGRQASLIWLR